MNDITTIVETTSEEHALAPMQSVDDSLRVYRPVGSWTTRRGLAVSTESLSGRFINPPPGKLYLLYGARETYGPVGIFHLSLFVASKILGQHRPIAVVDGANRFDAYYLARIVREQYGDPEPFLNNIYVSRGFTCYQMEAAITQRLPEFLRRMKSKTAMIFGLLDTFYDEQAQFREVQQSLQRILKKLHEMKKDGVSILLTSLEMKVLPEERNQLFRTLKASADQLYRLDVSEDHYQLFLESPQSKLRHHQKCHSGYNSQEVLLEIL